MAVAFTGTSQSFFVCQVGCGQKDLVFHDVIPQFGHQVLALVLDGSEPAEMVKSVVVIDNILLILDAHGCSDHINDGDGHIADIDNAGIGTQLAAASDTMEAGLE